MNHDQSSAPYHPVFEDHPLAELFPLMKPDELAALAENIREYGLQSPIVLHEGRILDGRNRYRACQLAGIEPHTRVFPADGDALAFVLSANLHRRHLNTSQRALLAAKIAGLPHGGTGRGGGRRAEGAKNQEPNSALDCSGSALDLSIADAAQKLAVGKSILKDARTVLEDAAQTRAVESGERTIHAAVQQIRAAQKAKTTKAPPRDPTGFEIPEALRPLWDRRSEVQTVLTQLANVRQVLQAALKRLDPLFELTNLGAAVERLDAVSASIARSLPYAVCDACDGVDFQSCPTCGLRGFLPESAFAEPTMKPPLPNKKPAKPNNLHPETNKT